MSYRITYGKRIIKDHILINERKHRKSAYVIILTLLLLSAVYFKDKIYKFILPGNPQVTEKALHELVTDIQEGEPVGDAVTAFCRLIIDNA